VAGDMLKTVESPLQVIDPHALPTEVPATPQTKKAAIARGLVCPKTVNCKLSTVNFSLTSELSSHALLDLKFKIQDSKRLASVLDLSSRSQTPEPVLS